MPRKAARLHLEDDPELDFEHRLARDLGRTVRELRASLDHLEFVYWASWYAKRDQAKQVANQMAGG